MLVASVGTACSLALGCGSSTKKVDQETSNLKPLMVQYGKYLGQHRGQPPANDAEFKAFVKSPAQGVNDPDALFVSSRDKQPYVILYGRVNGPPGPAGQPVIAYEQEGIGGRRYVASTLGAIEEVDEKRFRELVPDAK